MEETIDQKREKTAKRLGIAPEQMPRHIAVIMDGNGRWAQKKGKARVKGHRQGGKTVEKISQYCVDLGIESLALYSFSIDNWKRPKKEVNSLMYIYTRYLVGIREMLERNKVKLVQKIAKECKSGTLNPEDIDEQCISDHLYTAGLADPDLLIRTANERRISNFLLWQISYSEFYVTDTLWPDFSETDIDEALLDYAQRKRRFGNLP